MLGLNRRESKVFRFSLVGHVLVALACAIFGFLPSCENEEEVHVFELASASPFPAEIPSVQPPPPLPVSDPEPPKVVEPEPAPPKPKPTPPKTVQPKPTLPKPKPTPRKKVQPKPEPKPAPQPPQRVSFSQFKKDHKLPNSPVRQPKPPPNKPAPRIDDSKYSLPAPKLGNTSSRSTVSQSVLNAYLSQVQAKMDRVWKRLQASTDLGFGGEARLSFRVTSSGTIVSAKLTKRFAKQSFGRSRTSRQSFGRQRRGSPWRET